MKTLLTISLVLLCGVASAQLYEGEFDGNNLVLTNVTPIDSAYWENDTIRGWGLVTEGPQCEAKQVFAYQVSYAVLLRRNIRYLDAYKHPFDNRVIVWDFKPREGRRR